MNVDLCDFFAKVATDSALIEQLANMPEQNRLAASRALAQMAEGVGFQIPPEDFFPVLNVTPTAKSEREWEQLTRHVDMHTPVDPTDTQTLMTRVQVIVERQRIKVFNAKSPVA